VDGFVDASRHYETVEGRELVMPMVQARGWSRPLPIRASLPPTWGYTDIVAESGANAEDVHVVAADLLQHTGFRTAVKPGPGKAHWDSAVPVTVERVIHTVHTLDLSGGFDEVWARRFRGDTRTKIRKAEKLGVTVECDTTGNLIPVFYDLYMRSVERWARQERTPLFISQLRWQRRRERLRKFQVVAETLGSSCRTWLASVDGVPAAAVITLVRGASAFYWRGAMDHAVGGPTRANYLLHKMAIEDACESGCVRYLMGESSASIAQFKARFGAKPETYPEFRFQPLPVTRAHSALRTVRGRLREPRAASEG
jgi:hypothetical protein